MLGFVLSSNVSALLVQRTGRYKPFIVAGFVVMSIGFAAMSWITQTTGVYDVAWRVFLVGLGLGPAMPLLSLAMQNAAKPHQIGAVTANRQFFQQLGQAVGGAVFGVVLSTTLTAQLQQNFAPITNSLPPAAQAALDPEQFRNSTSSDDGGGQASNRGAQIGAALLAPIEQQRALAQAALGAGDPAARAQLISSPETLPEITAQLKESTGADPQALARANSAIDAAEQQAQQQAAQIGPQVDAAVKLSFATSITRIYVYAFWLAIIALVAVTLWLPEIPLGKSNRAEAPPAFE
jgi:MFS family permease